MNVCYTVLLIEDNVEDRALYKRYLQQDDDYAYEILEVETGSAALNLCQERLPDLILLNFLLPDADGLEILNQLRRRWSPTPLPVILLAGQGDELVAVQAMKSGAQDYLSKGRLTREAFYRANHAVLERFKFLGQLEQQQRQQRLFNTVALRIRQSLHLEEMLQVAVQEVRQFLKSDRVIVYQFDSFLNGTIVAESVLPQWKACLHSQVVDNCYWNGSGGNYLQGKAKAVSNIYEANLTECHIQMLEGFQVKANLVVPIVVENARQQVGDELSGTGSSSASPYLWGLLIVHQCEAPRKWQEFELQLLGQLAVQLAIGIQQAELYHNLQSLNAQLEAKVEARTLELQRANRDLQAEIMRRQITQRSLEDSERRFRAIFNNTFQFTGLLTPDGVLLEANQTALDFVGVSLEEVQLRPFWEAPWWAFSTATQEQLRKAIAQAAAGVFIRYEVDVMGVGGQLATIDFSLRPIKDESGKVVLLIPEGRDITDRKKLEESLQERELFLRLVMDNLPQMIFWKDRESRFLGCNRQILEHGGFFSVLEIIGKTDFEMPWREQAALYQADDRLVMESGVPKLNIEEPITKAGGEVRWLRTNKVPLRNLDNEVIGILGTCEDITDQKHTESALQELNLKLEARVELRTSELQNLKERQAFILTSSPGVVYVARAFGDFGATFMGANVRALFGYTPEHYTTDSSFWMKHIHPDDRDRVVAGLDHFFNTGYHIHEYRFLHANGTYRWVYDQCKLIRDEQENPLEIIGYWTDITDRKQIEDELRRSNAQLETMNHQLAKATRLKDEFLASMSHELRTPLNAILGLAEGVLDEVYGPLTDRQRKALTTIQNSGAHLLALINDILDLAKVEAGQMKLSLSTASVQGLCQSSLEVVKPLADRKTIQLTTRLPGKPLQIQVDERRMSQILINLLNNAIKFTPEGGQVLLEARLEVLEEGSQSSAPQLLFSITDTGIGIAPENLQKLFQSFVQIDSSLSRNHSGTGLGLALVKQLTLLHGGTVSVSSQVGVGSCFTVHLPYYPGSRSLTAPDTSNAEAKVVSASVPLLAPSITDMPLVLVAEDNEANVEALKDYLELQGCKVVIAQDGLEAVALAKTQPFRLILMDIQMPRLNGLDAIRQIRQIPDRANTPIIALTAMAMPNDRQQCLNAGATDYLSKPMNLKQLTRLIHTYLEKGNGA
ncbi:MAG: response regulator [Leptolyngbyaceae cyanobacterium bins.59]|nr:response regulator [Leptolyngbyaceae cyanobacterium bins.59]